MSMTVLFARSDFSNTGEVISRFEKEMEITKPKVLLAASDVETLIFDDPAEVRQAYQRQAGVIVVVDSTFMESGKPKYNNLMRFYRDAIIPEDNFLILDPWPIDTNSPKADRIFVQVASSTRPDVLPYLLEVAAYLLYKPSLLSIPEFGSYASLLTDEAANGGSLSPSTMLEREVVVVNCLNRRL